MKLTVKINDETRQDLINIATGLYHPLEGFMTSGDYHSVVERMELGDNSVWTLPITLDVDHQTFLKAVDAERLFLEYMGRVVGYIEVDDCFRVDRERDVKTIFKTQEMSHPGVAKELARYEYRVGGRTTVTDSSLLKGALTPERTRRVFSERGWETIVAFNTRNPIHRSHEHLQRVGLDLCDGLFINPLIGWKKSGDFTEKAVMSSYRHMIANYYPRERVYLEGLKVTMRYSGPREAVFHAILRRNLGCTHFIVGRDHAGVGNYYGTYEAQELIKEVSEGGRLGIEVLCFNEPLFCNRCSQIVTAKHCGHTADDRVSISGTRMRALLRKGTRPDERSMRGDIADLLIALREEMFIP